MGQSIAGQPVLLYTAFASVQFELSCSMCNTKGRAARPHVSFKELCIHVLWKVSPTVASLPIASLYVLLDYILFVYSPYVLQLLFIDWCVDWVW